MPKMNENAALMRLRAVVTIAITMAIALLLPRLAMAQGANLPDILVDPTDISSSWLERLFGSLFWSGEGISALSNTLIGEMAKDFSLIVSTVGGLYIFYQLSTGIVATANDGEFLGRQNSGVWGPIRMPLAGALMLPVINGYSGLQFLIGAIAIASINMANWSWSENIDRFIVKGIGVTAPEISHEAIMDANNAFMSYVCQSSFNLAAAKEGGVFSTVEKIGPTRTTKQSYNTARRQTELAEERRGLEEVANNDSVINDHVQARRQAARRIKEIDGLSHADIQQDEYQVDVTEAIWRFDVQVGKIRRPGACGRIEIRNIPDYEKYLRSGEQVEGVTQEVFEAHHKAMQTLLQGGEGAASNLYSLAYNFVVANDMKETAERDPDLTPEQREAKIAEAEQRMPKAEDLWNAMRNYQASVNAGVQHAVAKLRSRNADGMVDGTQQLHPEIQRVADNMKAGGWVTAGAWYTTLAGIQATYHKLSSVEVDVSGVDRSSLINDPRLRQYYTTSVAGILGRASEFVETSFRKVDDQLAMKSLDFLNASTDFSFERSTNQISKGAPGDPTKHILVDAWEALAESGEDLVEGAKKHATKPFESAVAELNLAFKKGYDALVSSVYGGGNTLASITDTGYLLLYGALAFMTLMIVMSALPLGGVLGGVTAGIPLSFLLAALITASLIMIYIIPITPAILWTAGVIGWIILVAEAIIAAPLWAFAHLSMAGDDFVPQKGSAGYGIVLNVLFRPILMLTGLIVGMGIFEITADYTIMLMSLARSVSLDVTNNPLVHMFGWFVNIIVLVAMLMFLADRSFSLIHKLPTQVLRWMGVSGEHMDEEAYANESKNRAFVAVGHTEKATMGAASAGMVGSRKLSSALRNRGAHKNTLGPADGASSNAANEKANPQQTAPNDPPPAGGGAAGGKGDGAAGGPSLEDRVKQADAKGTRALSASEASQQAATSATTEARGASAEARGASAEARGASAQASDASKQAAAAAKAAKGGNGGGRNPGKGNPEIGGNGDQF